MKDITTANVEVIRKSKVPPSVEVLFLRHSKARVLVQSPTRQPQFRVDIMGQLVPYKPLTTIDLVCQLAKYWSKK